MPVRKLNRQQSWLLPPTIDELIPDDHPARFIASVVDSLGADTWRKMDIVLEGDPLGTPSYNPRAMLGVWLYGFMTGTRSSRKLEAACRDQIPYLWITGWQHPDHNSLWRFYQAHRQEMRHLFKMTVHTAKNLNLIDLVYQAVDGTKVAANANKDRTYDAKGLERFLSRLDAIIDELEKQNESGNDPVPIHLPDKLRDAMRLREQVKAAMQKLAEETDRKDINLTDNETVFMKSRQGIIPAYNVQAVAATAKIGKEKGMILTAVDTVTDAVDFDQLTPMQDQANENTNQRTENLLADAGYHSGDNLADCEQRKQTVVMPESQDKALKNPYHKDNFIHDTQTDTYTCPQGQLLHFVSAREKPDKMKRIYHCAGSKCRVCPAFGKCTTCKHHGRELQIDIHDELLQKHRQWMKTDIAKSLYKFRKELIEPIFGIIKEQMNFRRFLLRGLHNVQAENTLIATAFNLRTLYRYWKMRLADSQEKGVGTGNDVQSSGFMLATIRFEGQQR